MILRVNNFYVGKNYSEAGESHLRVQKERKNSGFQKKKKKSSKILGKNRQKSRLRVSSLKGRQIYDPLAVSRRPSYATGQN